MESICRARNAGASDDSQADEREEFGASSQQMPFVRAAMLIEGVSSISAAWSMHRAAPSRATPTALTLGKL